jgi:hypothetical protein
MLEFIAQDGKIETKAGNVQLTMRSPYFSNEAIEGDITLPFTVPMTDVSRRWLNFIDRPEGQQSIPKKTIQLKRHGIPVLAGDLRLGDADDKQIELTLVSGSSPFAALIKDLHLDELELGFQNFATEAEMLAYFNATVAGNVFTHPYYLPTIISKETGYLNFWFQDQGGYVLEFNSDKTYMSPMLYYAWLLPKLFEVLGYEFDDKVFINNTQLRETVFFSMHNINSQEDPLTIHFADLLPHYKLSTWLIDIQNAFGVKFLFYGNKQKVTLDWQTSPLTNTSKAKTFPHDLVKSKAGSSVPNSFSYTLNDAQGIWPPPENMLPAVWERKDLPKPADFPNKFCYVVSEDKTYFFQTDGTVQEVINLEDHFGMFGNPPRNYLADFKLGKEDGESLNYSSNIHPLHVSYPAGYMQNFNYLEADAKNIPPYVLFAKHTTDSGINWVNADYFIDDFSFTWPKSTWLLQNKILPWWEFRRKAKPVESNILLSSVDLANWDWSIPIKLNNVPCLVEEMELPLSEEAEKMVVKVKAWTG